MPVTDSPASLGELIAALARVAARHAPADGAAWLNAALPGAGFAAAFAAAGRRIGRAPIGEADATQLAALGLPWAATSGADECGRAALVLAAVAARDPAEHVALVHGLFRRGEIRERQAVLRTLAALPDPARFAAVAADAHRSNAQPVFEALACDNAYPARHLADPAYFQLVVKALFVGAPLARVRGLAERTTPELVRMIDAFASERRAAGRPVPDDVALIRRPP
jgi:hypothetical protein